MKQIFLAAMALAAAYTAWGQSPWKFRASNAEEGIRLVVDLDEESIEVPGMEMFGPMNGYLNGKGVYGVWSVTSIKRKKAKEALVHLSNDLGSETQPVRLTLQGDSVCVLEQVDGNVIKRVSEGRKLVKINKKIALRIER